MALSKPKINTNWLLLALALLLGGGAAYLGNRVLERRMVELDEQARSGRETVGVVVAKRDLDRGESIGEDGFAVRQVPKEFVNADAVRPDDFDHLERQRLAVPMKRGDILLPVHSEGNGNQVFSATLTKGRRAMTFEVDTVNSISGMLRPGDRIDLIYSARGSESGSVETTRPLLSNVQILATDQTLTRRQDETGKERTFSTITLELSTGDAQRIIVAKQAGRLTALLRHPEDVADNRSRVMTPSGLFGSERSGRDARPIEYIVGGGGAGPADIMTQLSKLAAAPPGGTAAAPAGPR